MSHRSKSLKEIPKSNVPLAKDSLDTARSDLKSAKALYENECYPTAIYHLQQSLEKSWKSFGFYYGIITEGQARSRDIIGHKGSKVCNKTIAVFKKVISHTRSKVKALKNICTIDHNDQIPPVLPDDFLIELDSGIDNILREVNNFTANEDQIRNMPYEEMKGLIDFLTEFQESLESAEKMINGTQFTDDLCESIRQAAYKFWHPLVSGNPNVDAILRKCVWEELDNNKLEELITTSLHGLAVTVPLFQLAVITQVHEQTTRYRMDGISPAAIYTSSHPMIRLFPQIHALSYTTLANLERLYNEIPADEEESP